MMEKHSITEAMDLWKRVMNWTSDPFVVGPHMWQRKCFFCDGNKPNHEPGCVWTKAVELVKADEAGNVE